MNTAPILNLNTAKNKGGRPRKLKKKDIEAIGEEMIAWFREDEKNFLLKDFASTKFVHSSIFDEWAEKYPKFKINYELARELQEVRMVKNMMKPGSNVTGFIFAAKNLIGYRDRQNAGDSDLSSSEINRLKQVAKEQAKGNS